MPRAASARRWLLTPPSSALRQTRAPGHQRGGLRLRLEVVAHWHGAHSGRNGHQVTEPWFPWASTHGRGADRQSTGRAR